jgi:GNAT superfamily N-acetyltransferase
MQDKEQKINSSTRLEPMVSKSLYSQYILEREGKAMIEDHRGFATYRAIDRGMYIEDVFVQKDFRKSGVGREMINRIAEIAKTEGHTLLLVSVVPSANNSTDSILSAIACGFRLDSSSSNFVVLTREL